jgi:5-methylcytosine-specific restriction endonuclease McrA
MVLMATKKGDPRLSRKYREVRKAVLARDEWTCYYCNEPATTVDHIVPVSKAPELAIAAENLRACCVSCNSRKGSRSEGLFLQSKRTPPVFSRLFSPTRSVMPKDSPFTKTIKPE